MIATERRFMPLWGFSPRAEHSARVVEQHVNVGVSVAVARCERMDRIKVREVDDVGFDSCASDLFDEADGLLRPPSIARGNRHLRSEWHQRNCGRQPQTGAPSGDQHILAFNTPSHGSGT